MNINELLIEIQTQTGGIFSPDAMWTDWFNLILGLVFAGLAAWFIWIYFDKKHEWTAARPEYDRYKSGSYKGFWLRYRLAVVAFLAAVFFIFAITFVLLGLFDITMAGYDSM